MKTINVKPVELIGSCRAKLTLDDEFQIKGMNLENPRGSKLCFLALGHLPPIISQLQRGDQFFAHATCPDCLSRLDRENCVVFLLGHADKWALCQAISEYRRMYRHAQPLHAERLRHAEEPETCRQLRIAAIRYQKQGEYSKAAQKMTAAVEELKRAFTQ